MGFHRWEDIKKERFSSEELEVLDRQVDQDIAKMTLQEIRKALGLTQEELAAAMELSQPELSRVERGKNPLLATVRRYIEAAGGELEVCAVFDGKRVKLEGM